MPVGNLGGTRYLYAHSTRHVPGEVRIVPGDPTQSAPELAPEAKIYDPPPTPETARIRFELTGGLASPGAAEVPIDLHITSNFEFMGYHFSGRFPAEALELIRIENHIRKGIALIDNAEGEFTALSTNGARRMAAEGERVRASTLYFNVKPEVTRTQLEISLETLRNGMYKNGLRIRAFSSSLPVEFKIEPILINQAILKIDPRITVLGDANFDGVLDISDARTILGHLFLGEGEPECRHAADFDQDGQLSITDPINILGALFLGEPPLNGLEPKEVPCGE